MILPQDSPPTPDRLDPNSPSFPLVVVLGPTASGKSFLALEIAKHFGGEIVNFDSVQVYRRFDIGAAKVHVGERRGVPHHLVDIVEPEELFTAGDYARRGRHVLEEIRRRGSLPVAAGGTGFYLRALLQGLFRGPRRDARLRGRLESRALAKPRGYLHRLLRRLDPRSAERIHAHDTPKLIRAIEVCILEKAPMSSLWTRRSDPLQGYDVIRIGLDPPRNALTERIHQRTQHMFSIGLIEEVQYLLEEGIDRTARPFQSLGYRQALDHLEGKLTLAQAIEDTATATRRYAKRQMTWFRREPDVKWFQNFGDSPGVSGQVTVWLEQRLKS